MTILHAKTDPDLLTRLRQMLDSAARADIAVGYFFMSGFDQVADELARLRKTRILIGRADQPTLEAVAAGLHQADALRAQLDADRTVPRSRRQAVAEAAVSGVARSVAAMPQTDASQSAVEKLRQLVASGLLEVRAYPRGFMHAKAYLCWYDDHAEPGAAIVGSSNFTLAGFTGNTELNVRVTGDDEMAALRDWFEDLWADSVDVSAQVEQSLAVSWAVKRYTPYAVYLKALYELYGRDLGSDEPLPLAPARGVELANFQLDAVRRGLDMIRNYGGCYIADVVGLGKTYIGAELLRQLRQSYPNDGPPLIVCPAGLVPAWQQVNEQYGLGAEVLSQNRIAPPPGLEFDPETEQYEEVAGSARGVQLTESYRSRGLRDYLERGDHKVILLSATPQNLGPRDIYRQVRLFLDETEHGLPLEPRGLEDYFASVVRWQEYRKEVDAYSAALAEHLKSGGDGPPPTEPQRPATPRADISQALTPIFIRRRRKEITEIYGDTAAINGEPVSFPTPKLSNLEYRLDRVYAKAGDFTDLLSTLGRHRAVRYNPTEYLNAERRGDEQYSGLFRARGRIAGMIRYLLFKRLESSITAFRATLASLAHSNRSFKAALAAGYVPVGSVATNLLAGRNFNAEEALAILQSEEAGRNGRHHFPAADFNVKRWIGDLDSDHAVLSDLLNRIADIGPDDDDKLARLREFLKGHSDEKVLIFSEAETTVDYLFEQLNPAEGDSAIAKLSGGNRDRRADIVSRFAPQANGQDRKRLPGGEIRLLLATDVVSEGQNMQDCARVLNYDLHWNPVRLIQRFGRVDRIGSPHDEIHLHNMLPDAELDESLGLTGKLSERIQAFHDLIGLDNRVLSEEERLNAQGVGVIYDDRELPEPDDALDEVSANQRAIALLQSIRSNDPALWRKITELPDGIRSALICAKDGAGDDAPQVGETVVMLAVSDAVRCYAVGDALTPRPIRPAQFIAAAECEPDTPTQPLPADTNARVSAAAEAFSGDLSRMLGTVRRRTPGNARNRAFVRRQLNGIGSDVATPQRIAALRQAFAGDLPTVVENELSDLRRLSLVHTRDLLDDFLRKYFTQELSEVQKRAYPRLMLATNLTPTINIGDTITWHDVETCVTAQEYRSGQDLQDSEPVTYTSNAYRVTPVTFRRYYDPDLTAESVIAADQELMHEVNRNLRETFRDSARLAASGLAEYTRGNRCGLTGNVFNLDLLHTESVGNTKPRWGTPGARKSIVEAMETAAEFAGRHGWYSNQTTAGIAIMPIEVAREIRRYLTQDVPQLSALTRVDSVHSLGKVMWLNGWEIVADTTEPELAVPDAAQPAGWAHIDFLHPEKLSVGYTLRMGSVHTEGHSTTTLHGHNAVQGASRHLYKITLQLSDN